MIYKINMKPETKTIQLKQFKTLGKTVLFLLLFVTCIFISQLIAGILPWGKNVTMPAVVFVMNVLSLLITFLLVYSFRRFVDKKSFKSLGFEKQKGLKRLIIGSVLAITMMLIGFLIMIFAQVIRVENTHFKFEYLISSVFICIVTAIVEEVSFRGYILNNLIDGFNKYLALVISACLFSIPHLLNSGITILSTLNIFLAGIFLGVGFIYTGSLWFPIGFHLFWNLVQGLLGFSVSGADLPGILILNYPVKNIVNGGDFGFEGSIICTAIFVIGIVSIFGYYERKEHSPSSSKNN